MAASQVVVVAVVVRGHRQGKLCRWSSISYKTFQSLKPFIKH